MLRSGLGADTRAMHAQLSQTQHEACPSVPHTHARDLRDGSCSLAHSSTRATLRSTTPECLVHGVPVIPVDLMPVPHPRGLATVTVTLSLGSRPAHGNTVAILGHLFFLFCTSASTRTD